MRVMNRRLALTVAGSSALVAITAGAAIAANLGILTASPKADVGQLDATRVAELAVSTPASIAATPSFAVVVPAQAPGAVDTASDPQTAPRSTFVGAAQVSATEAPVADETPTVTPAPTPTTRVDDNRDDESEDEFEDESEDECEVEGSLDDHVQDDSFLIESPRQLEEVHVSERIR